MNSISDARRTPLSGEQILSELVNDGEKIDRRKDPENVAKRVQGHLAGTHCGSQQLYANNDLSRDPVADAAESDPNRLFNQTESNPPNFAIVHEKPEHRVIIYLKAQGMSNKEVAAKTGYNYAWVSQITRQPWFRLRLVGELKEVGIDQITTVLKSSALDSVHTLIDLRDDPSTPRAVRRACADSLLDRFLGRAVQKIETGEQKLPRTSEIQAIDDELKQVDEQLGEPKTNGQG
jgi:hypothetical protein